MIKFIHAPWTPDQVASLNEFQQSGQFHPFTCSCGCRQPLIAREDGWHCPDGGKHTQTWAHAFMAERFLLKEPDEIEELRSQLTAADEQIRVAANRAETYRKHLLRIAARATHWSSADVRAACADALGVGVRELERMVEGS